MPPVPEVATGPRGPSEMMLPVIDELTATEAGASLSDDPVRLHLTLAPCRFAEAEPNATMTTDDDNCRVVNQQTFDEREQHALVVPPGRYTVEVANQAFDRDLGVWLRREDDPSDVAISAGGIPLGAERDWTVDLAPGRWVYSCPLSPTPDYLLIVR